MAIVARVVNRVLLQTSGDMDKSLFYVSKNGNRFVPVGWLELRTFGEGFKDVHGEGNFVMR